MVGRRGSESYIGVITNTIKEIGNREICMVQEHIKIKREVSQNVKS